MGGPITGSKGISLAPSNWSLRVRLVVFTLALSMIPALAISLVDNVRTREALAQDAERAMASSSRNTADAIDRLNREHMQLAAMVASDDLVMAVANGWNPDRTLVDKLLKSYLDSNKTLTGLILMNAEGTAAFSTDSEIAGKKYDSSPYYQQAMKGSPYSSDLQVSAETGKSTIYYSAPIKDNGKTIGAAVARGNGSDIFSLIDKNKDTLGKGAGGLLVDENGVRLYDSIGQGKGTSYKVTSVALKSKSWSYELRVPDDSFLAASDAMIGSAIAIIALTLLISGALSLLVATSIARPIQELMEGANRLAKGDLSTGTKDGRRRVDGREDDGDLALAKVESINFSATGETGQAIDRLNAEQMQLAAKLGSQELVAAAASGRYHDKQALNQLLLEQMNSNSSFNGVFFMGVDGECLGSTDPKMVGRNYRFRPYFQHALQGELFTSKVTVSIDTKRPMVVYAAPIRFQREVIGVLAVRTDGSEISRLIRKGMGNADGDEVSRLRDSFDRVRAYLKELSEVADEVASGNLAEALHPRSPLDAFGIAFNGAVARLRELVGEIRGTAESLADVSEQLSGVTSQTGAAVQQVSAAMQSMASGSQEVSSSAQTTNQAVGQLSQAIDFIARGAAEQAAQVQAASNAASQMAAKVGRVASNANSLATASVKTKGSAQNGASAVRETVSGMAGIKEVVLQAAGKVEELGKLGEKIGAVVETIDDIAEQTNLLALNAAIEAARAGEHGRGFAVVADEVRKLAERSQRETKAIAGLIKEVQGGTKQAVSAMETGSVKVQEGSSRADQAREALEEILSAVDSMANQVTEIASAAKEMAVESSSVVDAMDSISAVVEENAASTTEMAQQASVVTSSVESVAAVAEENSASTQEVSASAQEMSAQVQQMSTQAQELAATAEKLRGLVTRFTVEGPSSQRTRPQAEDYGVVPMPLRAAV